MDTDMDIDSSSPRTPHKTSASSILNTTHRNSTALKSRKSAEQHRLLVNALQYIRGLGHRRIGELIDTPSALEAVLHREPPSTWLAKLNRPVKAALLSFLRDPDASPEWQAASRSQSWLRENGGEMILKSDSDYPAPLLQISDPPACLYVLGQKSTLYQPAIAVVGTRKPTAIGRHVAKSISRDLAEQGLTIVSGMALGIDSEAHRGALDTGKTVAVWASGLDKPTPPSNRDLAEDIVHRGCVITELPLSTPASPGYFPRRNRIVSGLCAAVLVVEAEEKSGSMITARLALEQNRDVFAVPGSINNRCAKGCHRLIKDGAVLIENSTDVLEALAGFHLYSEQQGALRPTPVDTENIPEHLRAVYAVLNDFPEPFEVLAERSGVSLLDLSSALIDLELLGHVSAVSGCYAREAPS